MFLQLMVKMVNGQSAFIRHGTKPKVQAIKTQKWQLEYFLEINQDKQLLDEARVKMLYKL